MTSWEDASNSAANSAATWWSPWQMVAGPCHHPQESGVAESAVPTMSPPISQRKKDTVDGCETLHKLIGGFSHYL